MIIIWKRKGKLAIESDSHIIGKFFINGNPKYILYNRKTKWSSTPFDTAEEAKKLAEEQLENAKNKDTK